MVKGLDSGLTDGTRGLFTPPVAQDQGVFFVFPVHSLDDSVLQIFPFDRVHEPRRTRHKIESSQDPGKRTYPGKEVSFFFNF